VKVGTQVEIPADKINLDLSRKQSGGRSVNANRDTFETGVKDLADAELSYPGWLSKLLTQPIEGLQTTIADGRP